MTVARAVTRKLSTAEELQSLRHWVQQTLREATRVNERIPAVERLQAQLSATREHLAVTTAHVQRLLGEKDALLAYSRNLERQLRERP